MTTDEVNDALEAASQAIAGMEPAIRQQIENAQQQITDASNAVRSFNGQWGNTLLLLRVATTH